MQRIWTSWAIAASLAAMAGGAWGKDTFEDTAVNRLLGKDYAEAKIVAVQGTRIVTVQLKTRTVKALASLVSSKSSKSPSAVSLSCRPCWSPDGSQVLYVHGGRVYVVSAAGGRPRSILPAGPPVRDATWWKDPGTKALCVVYATATPATPAPKAPIPAPAPATPAPAPATQPAQPAPPATFRHGLKDGGPTMLLNFPCTAGLSLDGTYLGHAGSVCLMADLKKKKVTRLNRGRPGSDGSMSPDNTYRLMFLSGSGATLSIRNRYDREVWRLSKPRDGGPWRGPRWSNDADFCTATTDVDGTSVLALIKISTKQSVLLRGLSGNLRSGQLWLPSAAGARTVHGPIDHLKLERLGRYKEKVAKAKDYSSIIAELNRNPDPEAAIIVKALETYGQGLLSQARHGHNPLTSQAIYRDLAARYSRHEIGKQARQTLSSPAFRAELGAGPMAARFEQLRKRLHKPPGKEVKTSFYDSAFLARNRAVLVEMVEVVGQLRQMHGGTQTYQRAQYYATLYGLPKSTSQAGNEQLTVTATVTAVSAVPAPGDILPAKEALVYVRYRVGRVVNGRYTASELVVVHWAVRFGRATAAAKFSVGERHHLTLDLFDAHPELEKIAASRSANNANLAPYWALSVGR